MAIILKQQMDMELSGYGLTLLNMMIHSLEVHPQMQRLWQGQNDYLAFNRALSRSILD
jgi:uncharacterized protein Usg